MIVRRIEEKDINDVYEIIRRNFDGIMSEYHSEDIIEKFKMENNPESLKRQMEWKDI